MLRRQGLWKLYLALIAIFTILISAVMGLTQAAKASQSAEERASECLLTLDGIGNSIVIDAQSGAFQRSVRLSDVIQVSSIAQSQLIVAWKSGDVVTYSQRSLYLTQPWLSRPIWLDDLPAGSRTTNFSWSPEGDSVIALTPEDSGTQPVLYDLRANSKILLPKYEKFPGEIDWSPDGNYVALQAETGTQQQIIIWSTHDASLVKVATGLLVQPDIGNWSPKAHHLVYYNRDLQGNYTFGIISSDGNQIEFPRMEDELVLTLPVWSEDGQYVAFRTTQHLYIYGADGTAVPPIELINGALHGRQLYPLWDGHTILILRASTDSVGLFAYDVESRKNWFIANHIDTSNFATFPFDARRNRVLFAWSEPDQSAIHVDLINLDGTRRTPLNIDADVVYSVSLTPDQHAFVYIESNKATYIYWAAPDDLNPRKMASGYGFGSVERNHFIISFGDLGSIGVDLIDLDSGYRQPLLNQIVPGQIAAQRSPDGTRIETANGGNLTMFDADGHLRWQIPRIMTGYTDPRWIPCS